VLVGIAAALTLIFALTPLDIAAARLFYSARAVNHWPLAARFPWRLLYQASTWITTSVVLIGLGAMALAALRRRALWRRYAVFLLLSVVIGPGLLINVVFKDHWDRPRPRDIVEFGGPLHYTVAPLRGEAGASFPCGHCSVGFLYALGWWIWRRRRPHLAMASAALGAAAGLALGLGRMAAGGHFLSDVLWSALIALGIAHLLFHYVLRIPAWEEAEALAAPEPPASRSRQMALATLAALGGAIVLLALFAAPHGTGIADTISLASMPQRPEIFDLQASAADVDITLVDSPAVVAISGELHGFGLPTSRLSAHSVFSTEPVPTLSFRIVQRGWFTDLNSNVAIQLPASGLKRLIVRLDRGNIRVTDATATVVTRTGRLALDLQTRNGIVQRP
jgi:membrane-associated PAP2 superfamily phosphatase